MRSASHRKGSLCQSSPCRRQLRAVLALLSLVSIGKQGSFPHFLIIHAGTGIPGRSRGMVVAFRNGPVGMGTQGFLKGCNFKVEPQTFTADLTTRLRSL